MIYTTGSIVRVIVRDTGEMVIGVVMRELGEQAVVATALQVAGARIVYSREVIGEVVEVIDGPESQPATLTNVAPPPVVFTASPVIPSYPVAPMFLEGEDA